MLLNNRTPRTHALTEKDPIRGEIFDREHLATLAKGLAESHKVSNQGKSGRAIMSRVRSNGRALLSSYRSTARAIADQRSILPAAEWLVDNFHVIDEQLREIRDDLPTGFYRGLPKLVDGELRGYPRVLAMMWSYIEHTDSQFEADSLREFLRAYQAVQPLNIGELWAIPVWLRLLLVENLRRLADDIVHTRADRERANDLADTLLGITDVPARRVSANLRFVRSGPISSSFAVELLQRLRDREASTTPTLSVLDERFSALGTNRDEIVAREHQRQAAAHVTVRNIVTSMRDISGEDWPTFFESVSLVDETLGAQAKFARSDFPTRDRCRAAIEELGRGSGRSEIEIARLAATWAAQSSSQGDDCRQCDPAYYLISGGRKSIESEISYRVPIRQKLRRAYASHATFAYLATIAIFTAAILAIPIVATAWARASPFALLFLGAAALIPASDLAIAIVNASVSDVVGARRLARLSLEGGITPEHRTLVAIPALLVNELEIGELLDNLEVHFLANGEGDVHFALVTDWVDAPGESMPSDEALLRIAAKGIAELNARYGIQRFYLFHRRRVHNTTEQAFMGWERKRGKLRELNRLLRGATNTSFITLNGEPPTFPRDVRYVITLDADTQMPRGTAVQLVGTAAHPLNRPTFDERNGRVTSGYTILQPRITPCLPTRRGGTLFQCVYSGPQGTDPYAFVVSDVYQDLFGEGIYTGKGVYEIDSFEKALGDRFADNTVLSHDLLEGIIARAGFASDIELFETFPPHYEIAALRQHRWIRGDWQLLPWILGYRLGGAVQPTSMTAIARWKLVDNLRRSLSAPAALVTLVIAWLLSGRTAHIWMTFVLATLALPRGFAVLSGIIPQRPDIAKRTHLVALFSDIETAAWQTVLDITFLAHKAYLALDAIMRTVTRLFITRRRLLEWTTAAQSVLGIDLHMGRIYKRMLSAVIIAFAVSALLAITHPADFWIWAPLTAIWAFSPAIARAGSLSRFSFPREVLPPKQQRIFQIAARKTWRFFETFVGSDDHQLPPDNFQESPRPIIAHRTSPTNIGLYLLSVVAAYDFGWIAGSGLVHRLTETINSLAKLERFRGHFFNWYDTETLLPLEPKYVSTVDSGNLAGHLIAVAQSCHEYSQTPLFGERIRSGLEVNIASLRESLMTVRQLRGADYREQRRLDEIIRHIATLGDSSPTSVSSFCVWFANLKSQASRLAEILRESFEEGDVLERDTVYWADAIRELASAQLDFAHTMFPWAPLVLQARGKTRTILDGLDSPSANLVDTAGIYAAALSQLQTVTPDSGEERAILDRVIKAVQQSQQATSAFGVQLDRLFVLCQRFTREMDFGFLYDASKKLFSIGYRIADAHLDSSYYDLLASEARLASFVAIAKGDVPSSHWQKLGRPLTPVARGSALLSWSGSMFEYLMPELVMRDPEGSLLDQTARLVVRRQIDYARSRGIPWGISESAYNARDASLNYQYSSFGVSGLGLRRGLSQNLVIAPYASALAAMISPVCASENLGHLTRLKSQGTYGFYEAIDFTLARLGEGRKWAVIEAYFAHHQGMTLIALANVLHDGLLRSRFHTDVNIRSAELLLHERTPRSVAVARPRADEVSTDLRTRDVVTPALRTFRTPHHANPRTHLLSNGNYTVMVTAAGAGFSRWGEVALTRWREDATRACFGVFIYLRDTASGRFWSAGYQPCLVEPDSYSAAYSEDRVEIQRQDRSIATTMEVVVSPEDDAEIRHISLRNTSTTIREIEVTSYVELALAPQASDEAHPAFSSLFVETEFVPEVSALVATRRVRSEGEAPTWIAHVVAVQGEALGEVEYETSRVNFVGRGGSLRQPRGLVSPDPLSGETGAVLSPVLVLRHRVQVAAGATSRISFAVLASESRENVIQMAQRYRVTTAFERTSTLAWTHAQVKLRHHGIDAEEAHVFQRLAGYLVYRSGGNRAPINEPVQGPSAFWSQGISGDLPVILLRIDDAHDSEVAMQLIRAHGYWSSKAFAVDVVILNERPPSYDQNLQQTLEAMIRAARGTSPEQGSRGRIIAIQTEHLSARERTSLLLIARVILIAHAGSLADQVVRRMRAELGSHPPMSRYRARASKITPVVRPVLEIDNGFGGFANDGKEYVIILSDGCSTPAPWINVIANEHFGFQVSELGSGYTWSENSRENQITGWSNDYVIDPPSEAIYIRDDASGEVWGPTASPIRETSTYIARHGFGYSRFEHSSHEIKLELLQFAAVDDPLKISRLTIRNQSRQTRTLTVAVYVEWVLGTSRPKSEPFLVTSIDETGALFAQNMGNPEFAGRTAFADLSGSPVFWTCDRKEFLGPHGDMTQPAGLTPGAVLSKRSGAGLDACAALMTSVTLSSGGQTDVVFLLGQASDAEGARAFVKKYRTEDIENCLNRVYEHWKAIVGKIQVATPVREIDILVNGWLLYQIVSCRMWARSALYQAGGAYGFRDQLQDSMALAFSRPDLCRAHLLRAAARQFASGDVQHWWHPPSGRGVRTHISDDRAWLPYAVVHYVSITQDFAILDEELTFLDGPSLGQEQEDSYFTPTASSDRATLFEHCAQALDSSLSVGSHGLPLMGTGDWNDGMNRVGRGGAGESVWLAWFLCTTLESFSGLAQTRGEHERCIRWRRAREALMVALERDGWDGNWYRRAFFDDGSVLGSNSNVECQIDSIAQSWAVISGGAPHERATRAMNSLEEKLVSERDELLLLLAPPFDRPLRSPGYISAYPPGIRENGGQYTHAAAWAVIAFATLGDGERATRLYQMINPIRRTSTRSGVERYCVEPYVATADIYSIGQLAGRGGWSWYTGSAAWLYRACVENILGFRMKGDTLTIDPCICPRWERFELTQVFRSSRYHIVVDNPHGATSGVSQVEVDGTLVSSNEIRLVDDGRSHEVRVAMKFLCATPKDISAAE